MLNVLIVTDDASYISQQIDERRGIAAIEAEVLRIANDRFYMRSGTRRVARVFVGGELHTLREFAVLRQVPDGPLVMKPVADLVF